MKSIYYRYFMYSDEEAALRLKINSSAEFGTVMVNGVAKRYTSIVTDPNTSKPDAIVVCKGDIRKIKHTPPK